LAPALLTYPGRGHLKGLERMDRMASSYKKSKKKKKKKKKKG